MLIFISGMIAMAYLTIAVAFLKFWRTSRDRLFLLFSTAFAILAVERIILALTRELENTPYGYIPRLVAFMCILAAIIGKNRVSR